MPGPQIGKFTCLARDVEVQGYVRDYLDASNFNIEVDPNYRNLIAFSAPTWQHIHCEQYGTASMGGCSHNPACPPTGPCDMTPPQVYVNGQIRPIKNDMHVRFRGDWVADHGHAGGFWAGLIKIDYAHAEFHPYWKNRPNFSLVEDPVPGGTVEESHAVCAPLHTQKYGDTVWNKTWGYAGHVPPESIIETVTAEWNIVAPPPGPGMIPGQTHKIHWSENVLESPGPNLYTREWRLDGNVLRVKVTIKGSDVNNTNKFNAEYWVFWGAIPAPLRKIRARLEPPQPPAGHSRVTVFAMDQETGAAVPNGRVYVDGREVAPVGVAFDFNNQCRAHRERPICRLEPPGCTPRTEGCERICEEPEVRWECPRMRVKATGYEEAVVYSAQPPE